MVVRGHSLVIDELLFAWARNIVLEQHLTSSLTSPLVEAFQLPSTLGMKSV